MLFRKLTVAFAFLVFAGAAFASSSEDRVSGNNESSAAASVVEQSRMVSGQILSAEDNSGLPGVNVVEKGTTNGTVTDIDGNFSLSVAGSQSVLVISSVGFVTQEVTVGAQSVVNVTLAPDVQALDEIVVTALGIEREQRSLGYDVKEIEGQALQEVAQDNVLNSLAGRVAGVTINQVSGPGSSVNVVIRGATSLTTDNQPLFVVDGVPMSNSLNNVSRNGDGNEVDYGNAISDLNPNDIESMTVLKGPSAAALYGTRAGNGVIIITTKSGKGAKKLGVDVSTSTLFEWPVRFLDFHYKYANGGRNSTLDEGSAYWGGPELDAGNVWPQFGYDEPTELRAFPDNMKNFLQTGITSTNSVALTGGGDKGNFRLSYSNMSMRGMIPEHDRYVNNLKIGINHKILDNLELESNITLSRSKSNDIPSTIERRNNPLQSVYQWSHVDIDLMKDFWVPGLEGIAQRTPGGEDNPYFVVHAVKNGFQRDRVFGNLALKYHFTPELSLQLRGNMDWYAENRETRIHWGAERMPKGNYTVEDITFQEINTDFLLAYNKVLTNWDINVSVGGNMMNQQGTSHSTGSGGDRRNGLVIPGLFAIGNIPLDNISVSNSAYERGIYSIYGLASIGFAHQLYLDITARNDWSSTLPPEERSYFYPSASLSWLANYTFDLPESINLLKLRAGWAQVGNDTGPYQLEQTLGVGTWNTLTTQVVPGTLLNPNLKPETNTSIEGGLELSMFENRLRFTGTYYNMDNVNQIFGIAMPQSSGYSNRLTNAGRINSKGLEITLGFTPIQNSNGLTWDVDFNFSRNVTRVAELPENLDFITFWSDNGGAYTWEGEEVGNLYTHSYAKVEDPNSEYYQWPILRSGGWIEFRDIASLEKTGNFNPDFLVGMQTRLTFGNWNIGASFDWRSGGDFVSFTYRYGESDWRSSRQLDQIIPGSLYGTEELANLLKSDPEAYLIPRNGYFPRVGGHTAETGGFPLADGNDGAFVPGVVQTAGADTPDNFADDVYEEHLGGPGTFFYPITDTYPWRFNRNITFDASFIKLRELSVGYRLPRVLGVSGANLAVYTRNLMLWTKSQVGIDPERAFAGSSGRQGNTATQWRQGYERQNVMPWTASLGFKLNFSF